MLSLEISSPRETTHYDGVRSLSVPTPRGQLTIRPGHAELFAELSEGTIQIRRNDREETTVGISRGVLHVYQDKITLLNQQ